MLTLAAVDEGILRLTRFRHAPIRSQHFLGRRRLGVDIRDDYGRLIAPPEGPRRRCARAATSSARRAIEIPQRTVALFSGPVQVGADGIATVTLDMPDFAGELRLMAVAWDGNRIGAAAGRSPCATRWSPSRCCRASWRPATRRGCRCCCTTSTCRPAPSPPPLTAEGAIALAGPDRLVAELAPNARALPASAIRATAAGQGVLRLAVTGPDGFTTTRESRITVRSSRAPMTEVAAQEIPPGEERPLALPAGRWLAGTWRASASFGGATRYDAAGMLRRWRPSPSPASNNSASQLLAFALAGTDGVQDWPPSGVLNKPALRRRLRPVVRPGRVQHWTGAYATEALLRARAAGAAIPEAALAEALKAIAEQVEQDPDNPEDRAAQAYRLHVLSLAGQPRLGAARRLLENLDALPTPLAKAQLGAAFARAGDQSRAEAAFAAALAAPARQPWLYDYGSAARDALAVAALLKESGLLPDRLAALQAVLPGPELTPQSTGTQEQAWAVAAAATLGRDGRPVRVAVNGAVQPPAPRLTVALEAPGLARNLGDAPVWAGVSVTGIPARPAAAGRSGMRVSRRFLDLAGQPLDLGRLRQNTVFVLLLEGRAETREAHRALVQQGLPAGWEIVGRLAAGEVAGMPWLGTLTETAATPALDDRLAAAIDLTPEAAEFRIAVRLRAVTAGQFELPGAQVEDMYRPQVFARQDTGRITVLPAE